LAGGVDRKQAEIGSVTSRLYIDTPQQFGSVLGDQKLALLKEFTDIICIRAVAVEKLLLDDESTVNKLHNAVDVGRFCALEADSPQDRGFRSVARGVHSI
jgi:hypothetical protein